MPRPNARSAFRLPPSTGLRSIALVCAALCFSGLGLSVYTLVLHYRPQLSACTLSSHGGGCVATITGPKSTLLGIPVPIYGIAYFSVMTLLSLPGLWRRSLVASLRLAGSIAGVAMVIYLMYTELVTLRTFCEYCTAVHGVTLALFFLIGGAAAWGLPDEE